MGFSCPVFTNPQPNAAENKTVGPNCKEITMSAFFFHVKNYFI